MTHPSPEEKRTSRIVELLILAGIVGLIAALRVRFLSVPFERDEGDYALGGWLLLHGHPLYRDFYTMRLPGVYLTFAAIQAIFGHSVVGAHFALLLANSATVVLVYFIGRSLFGARSGLGAALFYGVTSSLIVTLGQAANSEHFINLWVAIGLAAIISIRTAETWRLVAAGISMGFAFITKQHAALLILMGWLWMMLISAADSQQSLLTNGVRRSLKYFAAVMVPVGLTAVLVAVWGVYDSFRRWAFEYAGAYVGTRTLEEGMILLRAELEALPGLIWPICLLALLGIIGSAMTRSDRKAFTMLSCYLVTSLIMFSIGLYFRAHYFLFVYPPLAMFAGKGLDLICQRIANRRVSMACGTAVAVLAAGYPILGERSHFFDRSPEMIARARYGINPFPESEAIGKYIAERTLPDESILILGSEPQIYWHSGRLSATPHVHMYPLMETQPLALEMQEELIRQAEAARPRYIVLVSISSSWFKTADSPQRLFQWFDAFTRDRYAIEAYVDIPLNGVGEVRPFDRTALNVSATGNYISILRRVGD